MKDNLYLLIILGIGGTAMIVIGFILLQVRNQKRLLQKQKELAAAEINHQKELLNAAINSQETERQRIGKDLHDEVGSVLSSLRLLIENHTEKPQTGEELAYLSSQSKLIIDRVIQNVRQISHNLSPRISGTFGFFDAVNDLADTVNKSGALQLHLDYPAPLTPTLLPENTAMAVYRVLAELINNTLKHAAARNISLIIRVAAERMAISYKDDGCGFKIENNKTASGMGMRNIESRLSMIGASWKMEGDTGNGFNIEINAPLT